jgi:DNA mismatch repair protein MutL
VDIGFGGLNQIKITDNGSGIHADDLLLAIEAHATSKIKHLDDLYAINSMGFRGEALASIAAVSKLSILSKPAYQEHAMMLEVRGGSLPTLSVSARTQGTTIDVRDLFFNAPVRKKFLKTPRSEYLAIEMVVKRFALSAPSIAIILNHNGKQVFALPAALCEKTKLLRIKKLLGKDFVEQAIYLDIEQGGLRLFGWISAETYQRSQNDKQWFYINQRMVKDKLIVHAIRQVYDNRLHPGRYPACLLYLCMAPSALDVNVHPTKHEVRFQEPRLVHDFIVSHLGHTLGANKDVPRVVSLSPSFQSPPLPSMAIAETYTKHPLSVQMDIKPQVLNKWLILNRDFGLLFLKEEPYLVDMTFAFQQRLLRELQEQTIPLVQRPLLVPVRVMIEKKDYAAIDACRVILMDLGIQLDWVSETELIVRSIPVLFAQLEIKKWVHHLSRLEPKQAVLLKEMTLCQSFDAKQLSHDDQSSLADYVCDQIQSSVNGLTWCIPLDLDKCRELLGSVCNRGVYV